MNPNVTVEDLSATRKKLTVSLPPEEVEKEEKALLREFSKEARIPGFRPGKAPEHLIRKRHGSAFRGELERRLTSGAFKAAEKEGGFRIYDIVKVDRPDAFDGGGGAPVDIAFTIDIVPDFNLPEYKGIPVEIPDTEVPDEAVEAAIEELRRKRSDFKVVDAPAEEGAYVKVSYRGELEDGTPVDDLAPPKSVWTKQENTWEEAGGEAELRVTAITEALVGMAAGDETTVDYTFPADFPVEELAGKPARYSLQVHEVRERILPDLDEAFAQSVKAESVEELKDKVYQGIKSEREQEADGEKRRQVHAALNSRIEFPLPESGLERETESIMVEIMQENLRRGVPDSEFEEHKEELYTQSRRMAANRVKMQILLERIAAEEKIEVTEEDLQRLLLAKAYATQTKPEKLVRDLKKNPEQAREMQRSLLIDKTVDLLAKEASVSVKAG